MAEPTEPQQSWDLDVRGRSHRIEVRGSFSRTIGWYVDGVLVAEKKSTDEKVRLEADDQPDLGVVAVRFSGLGKPRRATLFEPDGASGEEGALDAAARALTGLGGIDFEPEPGSPAAAYDDRVRAHPQRYAAVQTASGVAKVVVPLVLAALLARLAFSIPWPNWGVPWPDLPRIPRPDLPDIPWPDLNLPDLSLPGWLRWILAHAKYVWPIVIAYALARAEIRRRQKQDALRAKSDDESADEQG